MQAKPAFLTQSIHCNQDSSVYDLRVAQSATTAATAVVWAIRNSATAASKRILYVRKIWMQLWFKGTGAATEMQYEWIKGTGCTAIAGGGVAVTGLLKRTTLTNPDVDCQVLDTGLTMTGGALGSAFFNATMSRLTHSATQAGGIGGMIPLDFKEYPIELAANEFLALRQCTTSVIGDCVSGGVEVYGGLYSP